MGRGWMPAEGLLDLGWEGRTEWPAAEIAAVGPKNIRHLELSYNRLTSIPGAELAKMTNLEQLSLPCNQLTALPPELFRLATLQTLVVYGNQLTALPPEIGRLAALWQLHVSDNQLTSLPPEIGRLAALKWLYVNGNRLTALPPEIGRLAALQGLYVHGNPVVASWPEPVRRVVNENTNALSVSQEAQCAAVVTYLRSLPAPAPAPAPAAPRPAAPAPGTFTARAAGPPCLTPPRSGPVLRPFNPGPRTPRPLALSSLPTPARSRLCGGRPCGLARRGARRWIRIRAGSARPRRRGAGPRGMRVADVCVWLRSLDLGRLAPAFEGCAVDGKMLLELTEGDLREELGVDSGLVRRRILKEISELARPYGLAAHSHQLAPSPSPLAPAPAVVPALPAGLTHHVFLSYRRTARDRAQIVRDRLASRGFAVFWDQNLEAGPFDEQILERIDTAACFVLLLSAGALDGCGAAGDWLRREIARACRLRKGIVPVVCEGAAWPADEAMPGDIRACKKHQATRWVPDAGCPSACAPHRTPLDAAA
eukprot:tig00000113_g5699.t1